MKKFIRVVAMVLVLASMVALMASAALAFNTKTATNGTYFVETGKSFWGKPTIKIRNTGSTVMVVEIDYSNGSGYKRPFIISPGKTSGAIKLEPNSSFRVSWSGSYTANATGYIISGRAIKDIW